MGKGQGKERKKFIVENIYDFDFLLDLSLFSVPDLTLGVFENQDKLFDVQI